ncbi:class II glutamine amidotransferase [Allokutzneria sp. NRRL B-24872]|uniref:class II glutamine amidotransferase n=1 Tax=Allokutzneria sp. NRRL B-24872 TaxID=1137961 RepID=UPI00117821E1|nr:class II glutamine amidotransferase [Allokutzneria sp. NRRL B-24872]
MCLLTFFPQDVEPNADALMNGTLYNDDGHGFAIVTGSRILVRRGMNAERVVADFVRLRRHHHGPALFHSRMGTHGSLSKSNCHPFPLGGDSRTVLAHNGILPKRVQPAKGDVRSDTRIAAEDFLAGQPFGALSSQRGRNRLRKWLTPYNKVVILTVDPRYRNRAYVINEESGHWDEGIWYSNLDYVGNVTNRPSAPLSCAWCFEIGTIDPISELCRACGSCWTCNEESGYCECNFDEAQLSIFASQEESYQDYQNVARPHASISNEVIPCGPDW